jgi:hypothetical protein
LRQGLVANNIGCENSDATPKAVLQTRSSVQVGSQRQKMHLMTHVYGPAMVRAMYRHREPAHQLTARTRAATGAAATATALAARTVTTAAMTT